MSQHRPPHDAELGIFRLIREALCDFRQAVAGLLRANRLLISALIVAILLVWLIANPLWPKRVDFAAGQAGSSYRVLAEQYAGYFRTAGINMVINEQTTGLDDGLRLIDEDSSPISAGFLTAGSRRELRFSDLVSLGSIQYSPVWLFYRGEDVADESDYASRRVAVGLDGTVTQQIFRQILQVRGIAFEGKDNFVKLPHSEAAQQLKAGQIDAMVLVDGYDAPTVQSLLTTPGIRLLNLELAEAYVRQLPYLTHLVIPRGSLDLKAVKPSRDINLLASSVTLLVEKDTHPVVQWIFLMASRAISQQRTHFFVQRDFFPAYLDQSIPLSEIAARYYKDGLPWLAGYIPLWLAVILDQIWLYLLAFFAVVIPLWGIFPALRDFYQTRLIEAAYEDLRGLEASIKSCSTIDELDSLSDQLDALQQRIENDIVFEQNLPQRYALLATHLRYVRDQWHLKQLHQ